MPYIDKVAILDILTKLGKDREAYDAYAAAESLDDLKAYLASLEGFPKHRVPSAPQFLTTLAKNLKTKFAVTTDDAVLRNSFRDVQKNLKKILRKDVNPEAALLQNIVVSTIDRVVQLAEGKSSDKAEMALARYVADLRSALRELNDMHTSYDAMKKEVDVAVSNQVNDTMLAVRETVQELFPDKFADFQKLLLSKLSKK